MRSALVLTAFLFASPVRAEPTPLFDGKTFAGWDGDTKHT